MLRRMCGRVAAFLAAEDGPSAVEYAVMLALIVVVCLVAIKSLGSNANRAFGLVSASLAAGS